MCHNARGTLRALYYCARPTGPRSSGPRMTGSQHCDIRIPCIRQAAQGSPVRAKIPRRVSTGRFSSRICCVPAVQCVNHVEPPPCRAELDHSLPNFLRHNESLSWPEKTDAGINALARSDHIALVRGAFDAWVHAEFPHLAHRQMTARRRRRSHHVPTAVAHSVKWRGPPCVRDKALGKTVASIETAFRSLRTRPISDALRPVRTRKKRSRQGHDGAAHSPKQRWATSDVCRSTFSVE